MKKYSKPMIKIERLYPISPSQPLLNPKKLSSQEKISDDSFRMSALKKCNTESKKYEK